MGEGSTNPTDPHHTPTIIQPSTQPHKTQKPRKPRKDTRVPQPSDPTKSVADEAVHKELGGGPRCQETMGDTTARTRFESVSKNSNDSLLARDGEEVFVAEQEVAANKENDEVNVVEEVVQVSAADNVVSTAGTTTTVSAATITTGDDGKGILIEPVKPIKKKDLIRLDEEVDLKLQAEFDEEERLLREKAKKEKEANIALIETWDDIQAKIDVDHQLAERFQAQEQEELSIEEKATLFQQLLEKRIKHFTAKRAEEKRNKPPTKALQR
ncbi:hypothetical protein Tco_1304359 [Tanacetum coccineum]